MLQMLHVFIFLFLRYEKKKTIKHHGSASLAQLAERSAVNRQVLGSIPRGGVFFFLTSQNKSNGREKNSKRRGPRGIRTPDLSHPKRESYPYYRPLALFTCEARGIRTPNLRVWNPTRYRCAIASSTHIFLVPDIYKTKISNKY